MAFKESDVGKVSLGTDDASGSPALSDSVSSKNKISAARRIMARTPIS